MFDPSVETDITAVNDCGVGDRLMAKGRPSKFKEENAHLVYHFARLGATDKDIAMSFKITEKTLANWKHRHEEFLQALLRGKEEFDTDRVEKSLLERALGYSHDEDKVFSYRGKIHSKRIKRHYPPETGAIALWLHNRRPDRWKDKREITGSEGGPIQIVISDQDAKL